MIALIAMIAMLAIIATIAIIAIITVVATNASIAIIVIIPTFLVPLLAYVPEKTMRKAVARAEKGRETSRGLIYSATAVIVQRKRRDHLTASEARPR